MNSNNFINDSVSENDYLGYLPYIKSFEYLISNHDNLMNLPIVFGIHGKWGVGKSTFMRLIKNSLDKKKFITIDINPWEFGYDQNFITIFLSKLYNEIKDELSQYEKNEEDFVTLFLKSIVKPLKLSANVGLLNAEYDLSKFNLKSKKTMVDNYISENFAAKEAIKKLLEAKIFDYKKIVVFIDDLDRCRTTKVIEVIESIKLVLNSEKCIFLLGCDNEYLENALSIEYKDFIEFLQRENSEENTIQDGVSFSKSLKSFSREYLEKIIQVPFYIPPLDKNSVSNYIDCILLQNNKSKMLKYDFKTNYYDNFKKDLDENIIKELVLKAGLNPRKIKRILNLSFLNYLFIKFKSDYIDDNTKKLFLNLLFFLGFLRDVSPEYYKLYLSKPTYCKIVFKKLYTNYAHKPSSYSEKEVVPFMQDQKTTSYFEKYFELINITDGHFDKMIDYIDTCISVSNITSSEDYNDIDWGPIGEIKSDTGTNRHLKNFLSRLNGNDVAQEFILWFFENIFDNNIFYLGIEINIHLYKKNNKTTERNTINDFLLRFEYNNRTDTLLVKFESGKFVSKLEVDSKLVDVKGFDRISKAILIDKNTSANEIEEIKNSIKELLYFN